MRKQGNERASEGGVSEALGFLLIFTMVIMGIGLVTLYGYPLLVQQQVGADEQIMEKNMIVLQNDVKSLAYKTVPYKETSLKIGSGTLTVYNSSTTPPSSTIRVYSLIGNYITGFQSGDLRYESVSAGTDISLQNGAVVTRRLIEPGSAMLAQPRWFYDPQTNTMVINLISFNNTGIVAKSGIGTVQTELGNIYYNESFVPAGTPIYVDYTPDPSGVQDYSVAWDTYFTQTLGMTLTGTTPNPPPAPPTRTYQLPSNGGPTTLVIKKFDIVIDSI